MKFITDSLSPAERYPYSFQKLSEKESRLSEKNRLSVFRTNEEDADEIRESLVWLQTHFFEKEYKVYFVFSELKPLKKSRLRSYKKLLGSKPDLPGLAVFQEEIEFPDGHSLFAAVLRLSGKEGIKNLENLIREYNFMFGFVVPSAKKAFKKNSTHFLNNCLKNGFEFIETAQADYLKLQKEIPQKYAALFHFFTDGRDRFSVEFLHSEDVEISN